MKDTVLIKAPKGEIMVLTMWIEDNQRHIAIEHRKKKTGKVKWAQYICALPV
jgi:hypothetical protein